MNPAHREFANIVVGLSQRPLPGDVLAVLHAGRRVASAASLLDESLESAVNQCTCWEQLVSLAAQLENTP